MKILELKDVTPKEPFKDCEVKFIHSENVSLAFWKIKSNGVLPEHSFYLQQCYQLFWGFGYIYKVTFL